MESEVLDWAMAAAIELVSSGLDALRAVGWVPLGVDDAARVIRETEVLGRRLHAVQVGVLAAVERSGVHKADGHASAKVMVRHCGNLSGAEALRRAQVASALRDLPVAAAAHAGGRLGTAQVVRIARVHANRRVREALVAEDAAVARAAVVLPYKEFGEAVADWERLADEDGAGDRAERADANRDFRMPRNLDGSNRFEGGGGSVDGQVIEDIWQRQVRREWDADWADARRRVGDGATADDLARSDAQRRYDAMKTCFVRGDLAEYGVEARTCTDLVVDDVTFERHLAKLFGTDPGPDPRLATWWDDLCGTLDADAPQADPESDGPSDATGATGAAGSSGAAGATGGAATAGDGADLPGPAAGRASAGGASGGAAGAGADPGARPGWPRPGAPGGLVGFRSSSIDGRPLDPTEVVVATLIGHVRRVVTGADGVVLDMGRKARLFTGARQVAVRLSSRSCVWTGCDVPSGDCQSDHLEAFNGPGQGRTDPGNGAPACGRHNRMKEQGFTIVRDERGRYHVYRPDGTEIT